MPVTHIEDPAKVDACEVIADERARRFCISMVSDANRLVVQTLDQLKEWKHALGVVAVPFTTTRKDVPRRPEAAVTSRRATRLHGLAVLGFAHTTVRAGKLARLRIRLPAWVRAELRRARSAGISSVKVRMVIQVSPRVGLLYTRSRTLRLRLRP